MYTTKLVILKYYIWIKCVYFIYRIFNNGNHFILTQKQKHKKARKHFYHLGHFKEFLMLSLTYFCYTYQIILFLSGRLFHYSAVKQCLLKSVLILESDTRCFILRKILQKQNRNLHLSNISPFSCLLPTLWINFKDMKTLEFP